VENSMRAEGLLLCDPALHFEPVGVVALWLLHAVKLTLAHPSIQRTGQFSGSERAGGSACGTWVGQFLDIYRPQRHVCPLLPLLLYPSAVLRGRSAEPLGTKSWCVVVRGTLGVLCNLRPDEDYREHQGSDVLAYTQVVQ
jgi:hypothetical protein